MYAMTAKKDNVVSLDDAKTAKLHAAMDKIGDDFTDWVYAQCEVHDVSYWTSMFASLTHALIDLEVIAESSEQGAESAKMMISDFHRYFGEALERFDDET